MTIIEDLNKLLASNSLNLNYYLVLYTIYSIIFIYLLYKILKLFSVEDLVSDVTDLQWNKNDFQRLYEPGDLPPFYPNGWLPVLVSKQLKCNQIKPIFAFGKDLVVYRGISGECHILDAYCPHLGANLGIGGTVVEELVKCSFHGWTFNGKGECTDVPGLECSNLPKAQIKVYKTIEMNGFIYVWHHSVGQEPDWYPKQLKEFDKMIYRGSSTNVANCHIQEIVENTADVQHFAQMHQAPTFLGNMAEGKPKYYNLILKLFRTEWKIKWIASKPIDTHMATFYTDLDVYVLGLKVVNSKSSFVLCGPATANVYVCCKHIFGQIFVNFTIGLISLGPMKHQFIQQFYTKSGLITRILAKYIMTDMMINLERDCVVWNNKKYLKRPYFAKHEQSLLEFRRWYSQFYSIKYLDKLE